MLEIKVIEDKDSLEQAKAALNQPDPEPGTLKKLFDKVKVTFNADVIKGKDKESENS